MFSEAPAISRLSADDVFTPVQSDIDSCDLC